MPQQNMSQILKEKIRRGWCNSTDTHTEQAIMNTHGDEERGMINIAECEERWVSQYLEKTETNREHFFYKLIHA